MKKIKKLDLNGMKETDTLLNDSATLLSTAGSDSTINISGGTLKNTNGGVLYTGNDGSSCFFTGVSASVVGWIPDGTACQWSGTIYIETGWAASSFNVNDFAHEYGHYLQQQEMGTGSYIWSVGISSVWDMIKNGGCGHSDLPYEKDATERGMAYLNANMKKPTKK